MMVFPVLDFDIMVSIEEMTLFELMSGINNGHDIYAHIPCSCVCVLQLYTGLDMFNFE